MIKVTSTQLVYTSVGLCISSIYQNVSLIRNTMLKMINVAVSSLGPIISRVEKGQLGRVGEPCLPIFLYTYMYSSSSLSFSKFHVDKWENLFAKSHAYYIIIVFR